MSRAKKIIHEYFYDVSELEEDLFWKEQFLQFSYGNFPKGITYNGDALIHRRGKKETRLELGDEKTIDDLITFLKQTCKIFSPSDSSDMSRIISEENEKLSETIPKSWSDVKKPTLKEQYLSAFVSEISTKKKLSKKDQDILKTIITLAITYKKLHSENVRFSDNRITEITGLRFEPKISFDDIPVYGKKTKKHKQCSEELADEYELSYDDSPADTTFFVYRTLFPN